MARPLLRHANAAPLCVRGTTIDVIPARAGERCCSFVCTTWIPRSACPHGTTHAQAPIDAGFPTHVEFPRGVVDVRSGEEHLAEIEQLQRPLSFTQRLASAGAILLSIGSGIGIPCALHVSNCALTTCACAQAVLLSCASGHAIRLVPQAGNTASASRLVPRAIDAPQTPSARLHSCARARWPS